MVDLPDPRVYELSANQRAATETLFQPTLARLSAWRTCSHCGFQYRDWDTLGALPCRGHPGCYNYAEDLWDCCGRQGRPGGYIDGCVRADHTPDDEPHPVHMYGTELRAYVPLPVFLGMPHRQRRALAGVEHVPWSGYQARYGGWDEDEAEENEENEHDIPPSYRTFNVEALRNGSTDEALACLRCAPGSELGRDARYLARAILDWSAGINLTDVQVLLYRTATSPSPPPTNT